MGQKCYLLHHLQRKREPRIGIFFYILRVSGLQGVRFTVISQATQPHESGCGPADSSFPPTHTLSDRYDPARRYAAAVWKLQLVRSFSTALRRLTPRYECDRSATALRRLTPRNACACFATPTALHLASQCRCVGPHASRFVGSSAWLAVSPLWLACSVSLRWPECLVAGC